MNPTRVRLGILDDPGESTGGNIDANDPAHRAGERATTVCVTVGEEGYSVPLRICASSRSPNSTTRRCGLSFSTSSRPRKRVDEARKIGESAIFVDVTGGPTHVLYTRALAAQNAHEKAIFEPWVFT